MSNDLEQKQATIRQDITAAEREASRIEDPAVRRQINSDLDAERRALAEVGRRREPVGEELDRDSDQGRRLEAERDRSRDDGYGL